MELSRRVEKDLMNIMSGGTAEIAEQDEGGDGNGRGNVSKKAAAPAPPVAKPEVSEAGTNAGEEPDRSDSDESDDSI